MGEKLSCPHAIRRDGVIRCGIYETLRKADLPVYRLDHTLEPHLLFLAGGGESTQCGIEVAENRTQCPGAHVPFNRTDRLIEAVRQGKQLVYPEQRHDWARIFSATADRFLG